MLIRFLNYKIVYFFVKYLLVSFVAFILVLSSCVIASCSFDTHDVKSIHFLKLDGTKSEQLRVELAYTQSMRTLGLMYRKAIGRNSGMLFIFPDSSLRQFWMKNTEISLDIIFINEKGEIAKIAKHVQPYSENSISSDLPSSYVLELNAGRADDLKLSKGDRLRVDGDLPIAK